jgi:hypothetical protein
MVRALSNALLVEEAELYPAFLSQRVNVVTVEGQGRSGVPIVMVRHIYDFNRDAPEFYSGGRRAS